MDERISLFKVAMSDDALEGVCATLQSGYIGEGPRVREFEGAFQEEVLAEKVVALNSCTSALTMALQLAGVGHGDFVISTPMTCLASNTPILNLGATPIWADSDPNTGLIDPASVEDIFCQTIVSIPNPKAVLCVHSYGYPCDLYSLRAVCRRYGVPLIEDSASAFGARFNGEYIGENSEMACFSFQAIKPLTCGDGGMLVMSGLLAEARSEDARLRRWYGLDRHKGQAMSCLQDPPMAGWKWHMNDVAASIGLGNLKLAKLNIAKAQANARVLRAEANTAKIQAVRPIPGADPSYWVFGLLADDPKAFKAHMEERGIDASEVHGRNDGRTIFARSKRPLPGVDEFSRHFVAIPCGWWVGESEQIRIVEALRSY